MTPPNLATWRDKKAFAEMAKIQKLRAERGLPPSAADHNFSAMGSVVRPMGPKSQSPPIEAASGPRKTKAAQCGEELERGANPPAEAPNLKSSFSDVNSAFSRVQRSAPSAKQTITTPNRGGGDVVGSKKEPMTARPGVGVPVPPQLSKGTALAKSADTSEAAGKGSSVPPSLYPPPPPCLHQRISPVQRGIGSSRDPKPEAPEEQFLLLSKKASNFDGIPQKTHQFQKWQDAWGISNQKQHGGNQQGGSARASETAAMSSTHNENVNIASTPCPPLDSPQRCPPNQPFHAPTLSNFVASLPVASSTAPTTKDDDSVMALAPAKKRKKRKPKRAGRSAPTGFHLDEVLHCNKKSKPDDGRTGYVPPAITQKLDGMLKYVAPETKPLPPGIADGSDVTSPGSICHSQISFKQCSICMEPLASPNDNILPVSLNACGHIFHRRCLREALKRSLRCPECSGSLLSGKDCLPYLRGNMPSGSLVWRPMASVSCAGYEGCRSICLSYVIHASVQKSYHQNPGRPHGSTRRTAYLPDNQEGRELLSRLQVAFLCGLTFSVGTSLTTNRDNSVTWAIHHKTSTSGGIQRHGYPDDNYFSNCNAELDAAGVPDSSICAEHVSQHQNKVEDSTGAITPSSGSQMLLFHLIHAKHCGSNNTPCSVVSRCSNFKALNKHIQNCTDRSCGFNGCKQAKAVLEHFDKQYPQCRAVAQRRGPRLSLHSCGICGLVPTAMMGAKAVAKDFSKLRYHELESVARLAHLRLPPDRLGAKYFYEQNVRDEFADKSNDLSCMFSKVNSEEFTQFLKQNGLPCAVVEMNPHMSTAFCKSFVKEGIKCVSEDEKIHVRIVFHGTPESNVDLILQSGLDQSKRRRQLYGPGEYFSRTPGLSIRHCQGGQRTIVFAVITAQSDIRTKEIVVVEKPQRQLPVAVLHFVNSALARGKRSSQVNPILPPPLLKTAGGPSLRLGGVWNNGPLQGMVPMAGGNISNIPSGPDGRGNNNSIAGTIPSQHRNPNNPEYKFNIRHQQQLLLLLHHSSKCAHEDGKCKVTPYCGEMKKLLKHMERCTDNACIVPQCSSFRSILSHYRNCKDSQCPTCRPVRETVQRTHEQRQEGGGGRMGSLACPVPPQPSAPLSPEQLSSKRQRQDPAPRGLPLRMSLSWPPSWVRPQQSLANLAPAELKGKCLEVLEGLQKHPNGWVFATPVNPVQLGLSDYFDIIKKPMDLGTIKEKLVRGSYQSLEDFAFDVRLTFENAMRYNKESTLVHNMAKELLKKFETDFKKLYNQTNSLPPVVFPYAPTQPSVSLCPEQSPNKTHKQDPAPRALPSPTHPGWSPSWIRAEKELLKEFESDFKKLYNQTNSLPSAVLPCAPTQPSVSLYPEQSLNKRQRQDAAPRALPLRTPPGGSPSWVRPQQSLADLALAELKRKCLEVLKGLQKHQHGWVFATPVNPVKLGLPDYFDIIKKPMDLGTIQDKLVRGSYQYLGDFAFDVRLTFENAMRYNKEPSVIHEMAKELLKKFETDFKKLCN